MTNLDSILKSRDITLPTKVHLVKAMVFPVVMYRCESWTVKKAECERIDAFELWSWTARRSNQSILKETSPVCSLEGLMLKLKLQYFGHLMRRADSWEKTLMLGKIEGRRRRGRLLGASMRNSARGKGHEEGGSAYAKAGSSLRSPPGNFQASTPKTRVCLLYCFVLSPTPLTLWGAVPHHLSLKKS